MKQFIGTKIIKAESQNCPSDIHGSKTGDTGYKVEYEDGYISWSPKKAFEDAYREVDSMSFGLAIEAIKKGKRVARKGWNGKGMWLEIVKEYRLPDFDKHLRNGLLPFIGMVTADDGFVPWLASQTDMLSDDWQII